MKQELKKSNAMRISIVGRPNVGKSTIFNALTKSRKAITAPESGVTRDVVTEQLIWDGLPVQLQDSGGLRVEFPSHLEKLVQQKSLSMLKDSDLILWVLALGEFSAEDELIKETLLPMRDKCILVVNKVDIKEKEHEALNFYELGFSPLCPISSLHRRGLEELQEECLSFLRENYPERYASLLVQPAEDFAGTEAANTTLGELGAKTFEATALEGEEEDLEGLAATAYEEMSMEELQELEQNVQQEAEPRSIRIALIGKPNTGKSTLCNHLLGEDFSLVSDIAGTTRDVLEYSFSRNGQDYVLYDTAGIRRKNKVHANVEYYSVNRAIRTLGQVDLALLMIDSQEGLQIQDKKIAQQIIRRGKGLIFVLNKIDLLPNKQEVLRELEEDTKDMFPHLRYAPVCMISAMEGKGVRKLFPTMERIYEQLNSRINTGLLNQALQDWLRFHPPPSSGNSHYKLRYLIQVSVNPLRFILFTNRTKGFPQSYLNFIQNQIRRELGFTDVPLFLHLHQSS